MNAPDARLHNPDPAYIRALIERTGLSQREAARRIGIGQRVMRCYLAPRDAATAQSAPYPVQYALEALARHQPRSAGAVSGVKEILTPETA